MNIRIFYGSNRKELEEQINFFIQDLNVVSISQSESYIGRHWHITITLLYVENSE